MKSKITSISTLVILIAATSSYTMNLNFDLALLNQQLTALNQNLVLKAPVSNPEQELYKRLENLKAENPKTDFLYGGAFITPITTYTNPTTKKDETYVILGLDWTREYSAFGGKSDAGDIDPSATSFKNQRSPYITAIREFAEESDKEIDDFKQRIKKQTGKELTYDQIIQSGKSHITGLSYADIKKRLMDPQYTTVIIANRPWRTKRLNALNFIVRFTPAEMDNLRKRFEPNSEVTRLASINFADLLKAIETGAKKVQAKVIDNGRYQKGFNSIPLRDILIFHIECYLENIKKENAYYVLTCKQ